MYKHREKSKNFQDTPTECRSTSRFRSIMTKSKSENVLSNLERQARQCSENRRNQRRHRKGSADSERDSSHRSSSRIRVSRSNDDIENSSGRDRTRLRTVTRQDESSRSVPQQYISQQKSQQQQNPQQSEENKETAKEAAKRRRERERKRREAELPLLQRLVLTIKRMYEDEDEGKQFV